MQQQQKFLKDKNVQQRMKQMSKNRKHTIIQLKKKQEQDRQYQKP